MSTYYYSAHNQKGFLISGTVDAPDAWLARKSILQQNLVPLEVRKFGFYAILTIIKRSLSHFTKRITFEEKLVLLNQLETGFSVGIPILVVLEMAKEDIKNLYLKQSIEQIHADVSQGSSLYQACAKHPDIFSFVAIGMIKTGEQSGKIEETLRHVIKLQQQESSNQAKIKSAIFYPKIVISFMAVVLMVVVFGVLPKIKTFLSSLGRNLPLITRMVMGFSDIVLSNIYIILPVIVGGLFAIKWYLATENGRFQFDKLKLKLPVFGKIFMNLELTNFCVVLDLLLTSGIPLLEALKTLQLSQSNEVVRREIARCGIVVQQGTSFGRALSEKNLFPTSFKRMIAMGEEAGNIPKVLQRLGDYFQRQVDYSLDNLSKLIEPILLMMIFVLVLILALAVFLPIWKMSAAVRGR